MTTTREHAHLADHSYGRDARGNQVDLRSLVGKHTEIDGHQYKVLAYADKPSGYQGAVYQRVDTGEIVVAHRGTEFERQKLHDLVKTDGGMVVARTNDQANDAIDLTRQALGLAKDYAERKNIAVPEITVTGHSLGGTLAQISGHYFGLNGETFNAYGAASLNIRHPTTGQLYRLPEGGQGMLNHVMGADLVSAGSTHYGQTRVYTNQREIETLEKYGYANNDSRWFDARNDVGAAVHAMKGGSHDMHNFLPWDGNHRPDRPILEDPNARTLAAKYDPMIDKFRADVHLIREAATTVTRSGLGQLQDAVQLFNDPLPAGEPARREEQQRQRRGASLEPEHGQGVPDMRDPVHPAHGKYQQVYAGVSVLDRTMGRTPDHLSERLAASLIAASVHVPDIANVTLSKDGGRAFVLSEARGGGVRDMAHVETASAVQTPVEESTRQWRANAAQHAHMLETSQERTAERGPYGGPAMV